MCSYHINNISFMKDIDPDRNRSFFKKHQNYKCDINEFNFIFKTNTFSIIHTNIRSLSKNYNNLSMFLRQLSRDLSCIGLSESWLNIFSPISMFVFQTIPSFINHSTPKEVEVV